MELQQDLLERASLVLRGPSPDSLHRSASRAFDERLGDRAWRMDEERFTPCLVTMGGRVRLYEGRFHAVRV